MLFGSEMKLSEILTPDFIFTDLEYKTKDEAIISLVKKLDANPYLSDITKITQEVLDREKILSTGVGNGFAIPHAKSAHINGFVLVFAKLKTPIEFQSHDGKPVDLIFLLLGKETMVTDHIKLLSKISRLMNNDEFRKKIGLATNSNEIFEIIKKEES
jgi:fructose-specific phosphotransferase system IIA component